MKKIFVLSVGIHFVVLPVGAEANCMTVLRPAKFKVISCREQHQANQPGSGVVLTTLILEDPVGIQNVDGKTVSIYYPTVQAQGCKSFPKNKVIQEQISGTCCEEPACQSDFTYVVTLKK